MIYLLNPNEKVRGFETDGERQTMIVCPCAVNGSPIRGPVIDLEHAFRNSVFKWYYELVATKKMEIGEGYIHYLGGDETPSSMVFVPYCKSKDDFNNPENLERALNAAKGMAERLNWDLLLPPFGTAMGEFGWDQVLSIVYEVFAEWEDLRTYNPDLYIINPRGWGDDDEGY